MAAALALSTGLFLQRKKKKERKKRNMFFLLSIEAACHIACLLKLACCMHGPLFFPSIYRLLLLLSLIHSSIRRALSDEFLIPYSQLLPSGWLLLHLSTAPALPSICHQPAGLHQQQHVLRYKVYVLGRKKERKKEKFSFYRIFSN